MPDPAPATRPQRLRAWLVHGLTASGAVLAILAVRAIERGRWSEALLWLFAALVIDGVDGTLARAAHVKTRASRIDGEALDLVIDYLTYVFVPTLLMWRAGLLPSGYELPLAALIQFASLYVFARRDMKTEDGYFRGFPALWNIVALYLLIGQPGPEVAAVVIIILAVLTFAPIHVVHPFRVRDYGGWLLVVSALWAASTVPLLIPDVPPSVRTVLLTTSLFSAVVLISLGLLRTFRQRAASPGKG
jgi:phosphatidylcholine synthase